MTAPDLRSLFALANAFKEGDLTVGGTTDDRVRHDARQALLSTSIAQIRATPFVDDGVTAALASSRDRHHDSELTHSRLPTFARSSSGRTLRPGRPAMARRSRAR
jgi:hypothetical protein